MENSNDFLKKKRKVTKKTNQNGVVTMKVQPAKVVKPKPPKPQKKITAGEKTLEPIKPFLPTMKELLKEKGVNVSGLDNATTLELFYNEFVSKKGEPTSNLEPLPVGQFSQDYLFRMDAKDFDPNNSVLGVTVASVAGAAGKVIKFFKDRKAKKAAAKAQNIAPVTVMSKVDLKAAAATEKVEKELERKATDEKAAAAGITDTNKTVTYLKYAAIATAIGLLIYFIAKKLG